MLGVGLSSIAQFAPPRKIDPILKNPVDGMFADLNGDSLEDILVIAEEETGYFRNLGEEYSEMILLTDEYHLPTACDVGDINGDGHLDVIVAYEEQGELIWFENDGDGLFGEPQLIMLVNPLNSIHCEDFDNDEINDLLYYDGLTSEVVLALGTGNGEFEEGEIVMTDVNSNGLEVADLDGDGNLDFVGPSSSTNYVGIAWGGVDGTFESEAVIYIDELVELILLSDLNGDDLLDIALSTESEIGTISNNSDRQFGEYMSETLPLVSFTFLVENIVGSLDNDLIVIDNANNEFIVYENLGDFQFQLNEELLFPEMNIHANFGSQDDGNDINILIDAGEALKLLQFSEEQISTLDLAYSVGYADDAFISDIDSDGFDDYCWISGSQVWVAYGSHHGKHPFQKVFDHSEQILNIEPIDLNHDDISDLLFFDADLDFLGAIIQTEPRNWEYSENVVAHSNSLTLETGDIDGDGWEDILLANSGDDISLFKSIGPMQFEVTTKTYTDYQWQQTALEDLDGDGDLDLIFYGQDVYFVEFDVVYATEPELITFSGFFNIAEVLLEDFTNDGVLDVVTGFQNLAGIRMNKGMGGLNFGPDVQLVPFDDLHSMIPIDLEYDGMDDILVCREDGQIDVLRNDGGNGFISEPFGQNLETEAVLLKGDLNSNGQSEIYAFSQQISAIHELEILFESESQIQGHTFLDFSGNGIQDPEDIPFPFVKMRLGGLDTYYYSNIEGDYTTYSDTGTFTVFPEFDESLFAISTPDLSYTVTLSEDDPTSEGHDFGLTPIAWQEKINGEFVTESPRCEEEITHWLSISNEGNSIPSGVVAYELDELCEFVEAIPAPDSTNENTIYFSYSDLFYFSQKEIEVVIQMPPAELPMPWLTHYMTTYVEDEFGELYVATTDSLSQRLLCGYDPNDKLEEIGYTPEGFITPDDTMEYTVRFQNTGNDTVFCCMIRDQLPFFVDRSTIQPIQWSHDFELNIESDGEAVFRFDNINLLDSASSPLGSQGFVKFTAEPVADIADGTKIYNTADIYFDLNSPITTNTFVNEIYDCDVGIEMILNQTAFCLGDTLEAAHGYKGLSTIEWQLGLVDSHDTLFCTILDQPGEFYLNLLSEDPLCGSRSDSILISVSEMISPGLLTEPEPICEGESIMLTSTFLEGNSWYFNDQLLSETAYVMADQDGDYELQIDNEGCLSPFLSVEVDVIPTPDADILAVDSAICLNASTLLVANDAQTYQWWFDAEQIGVEQMLEIDEPGHYLLLTLEQDCISDPDSVEIFALETPTAEFSGETTLCEGDSIQLFSVSPTGNTWFLNEQEFSNAQIVSLESPGEITLMVDNGICANESNPVMIEEISLPEATASSDEVNFCPGESVWVEAGSFDEFGWYLDNILLGEDDEFEISSEATFQLIVKEDGCWSLPIEIISNEQEAPPEPTIVEEGSALICSVDAENVDYMWWFYNQHIEGSNDVIHNPEESGLYRVSIQNDNGCVSESPQFNYIITSIENGEESSFIAYPNPFESFLALNGSAGCQARLHNELGQLVEECSILTDSFSWDLSNLASGTYHLLLLCSEQNVISKVVKH